MQYKDLLVASLTQNVGTSDRQPYEDRAAANDVWVIAEDTATHIGNDDNLGIQDLATILQPESRRQAAN